MECKSPRRSGFRSSMGRRSFVALAGSPHDRAVIANMARLEPGIERINNQLIVAPEGTAPRNNGGPDTLERAMAADNRRPSYRGLCHFSRMNCGAFTMAGWPAEGVVHLARFPPDRYNRLTDGRGVGKGNASRRPKGGGATRYSVSTLEGTRMVSSLTRNQVRRKPLRVRLPCPPLAKPFVAVSYEMLFSFSTYHP